MVNICEKVFPIFSDFDYYELLDAKKEEGNSSSSSSGGGGGGSGGGGSDGEVGLDEAVKGLEAKKELHFLRFLADIMRAQDEYYEKSAKVYSNLQKKIEVFERYLTETYTDIPAHEGIVYAKNGDRYMMVLRGDALRRFRERDLTEPPIDVITCSLRLPMSPSEEDSPGRFKFEILSPKIPRPIVLYTDTEAERSGWSKAIQSAIARNISSLPEPGSASDALHALSVSHSQSHIQIKQQGSAALPGDRRSMLQRSQSVSASRGGKRLPVPLPPQALSPPALVRPGNSGNCNNNSGHTVMTKRVPEPRARSQEPPESDLPSDETPTSANNNGGGNGCGGSGGSNSNGNGNGSNGCCGNAGGHGIVLGEVELEKLWGIPGNEVCAECGAKKPEWAVINQGILICLECSGVHRSLGTHVSKVRSLLLDKWNPETLLLIKDIGNTRSKGVLEYKLAGLTNVKRLYPSSDRPSREEFIRNKYARHLYVDDTDVGADPSAALYAAVSRRNNENVALLLIKLLANGADPNSHRATEESKTSVFQPLVRGNLLNLEILLLNGASVAATDERGWSPFHYAAFYNRPRCLRRLMESTKGKIPESRETPLTPFDIAVWNHAVECIRLLRGVPDPSVEFTFSDVLNGHNSHEDVFTIPQRTLVPPKEMCSRIPKVRIVGMPLSKSSAALPSLSPPSNSAQPPSSLSPSISASAPMAAVPSQKAVPLGPIHMSRT